MLNHSACPDCSLGILHKSFSSLGGLIWLEEVLGIPLLWLSRENPQGWAPKASASPSSSLGDATFERSELAKSFRFGVCGEGFAVSVRRRIFCAHSHPQSGATVPREPPGDEVSSGSSRSFPAVALPLIPEECPRHSSCWPGDPRDLFIES